MCLTSLSSFSTGFIGYKVFCVREGNIVPLCMHPKKRIMLPNIWLDERNFREIPSQSEIGGESTRYPTGFHIFPTISDARDYCCWFADSAVYRVAFQDVVSTGIQQFISARNLKVIVAKKIKILNKVSSYLGGISCA